MGDHASELGPIAFDFYEGAAKLGLFGALRECFLEQTAEPVLLALNPEDVLNFLQSARANVLRNDRIYRGYDTSVRLAQPTASVTVKASQSFAFKPFSTQFHPKQQIKLYPFSTKRQYRELVVGGTTNWGGSKDRKSTDNSIPLKFKKISDGCYKVTPEVTLPKGEYAFSLASVGMGTSADVKGTNAGFGSSIQGKTWFGFSIK